MKYRRVLALLLCTALCILPLPARAAGVTLTAVNDTFLPLSASTMPTRVGGVQYVPYTVFTGVLGISGAYHAEEQTLTLSSGSTSLLFQLRTGTVYDQNMTSYTTPAYQLSGTVYVPVKLVCGKFGLTFSNITAEAPIVRICSSSASLSDSAFVKASADTISSMLRAYSGTDTPSNGAGTLPPDTTGTPGDPAVPAVKPRAVYLAYLGTPDSDTPAILDALRSANLRATFFLPADGSAPDGDLLRQIVGQGHAVGFVLLSAAQDMSGKLRAANDLLFQETGTVSRLVCISDGAARLSAAQQDGLAQAGFRVWDAKLDSRDHSLSAARAAQTVITACGQTEQPVVIRMGHYGATAQATAQIAAYLNQAAVPAYPASLTRTPPA